MSAHSLEAERQAILDRMQARRERYRRMLTDGTDLDEDTVIVEPRAVAPYPAGQAVAHVPHAAAHGTVYRTAPLSARHNPLVQTLMEHPVLVALGVAALVAIGPKRILRGVTAGGTALSAIAVRDHDQSNVDLAGRLLTMVGAYVQGRMNPDRQQ